MVSILRAACFTPFVRFWSAKIAFLMIFSKCPKVEKSGLLAEKAAPRKGQLFSTLPRMRRAGNAT